MSTPGYAALTTLRELAAPSATPLTDCGARLAFCWYRLSWRLDRNRQSVEVGNCGATSYRPNLRQCRSRG